MHYCQSCDNQHLMEAHGDTAVCPTCGRTDTTARRLPVYVVTGASGAGKTTIFELLVERLSGRCVVFDVDWLMDPLGRQPGGIDWTALRDSWLHVAHGVAQSGLLTLLLGPFIPEQLDSLPGRRWVADIHYLVLDCPDDERRARAETRPGWWARDIADQIEFGQWLRDNLESIDTSRCDPHETAEAVAKWVDSTT
jgi:hypothetical protein